MVVDIVVVECVLWNQHRLGLKIAIADCDEKNLTQVGIELTTLIGQSNVLVIPTDVSKLDQVVKLRDKVYETWGEVRNCCLLCAFFLGRWQMFVSVGIHRDGLLLPCVVIHMFLLLSDLFLGPCPCRYLKRLPSFHFSWPSFTHPPTLIPI